MKKPWMAVIIAIGVINVGVHLSKKRLWRDTHIKFHGDELVLPSGDEVPTGRWFTWPSGVPPIEEQYAKYPGIFSGSARGETSKVLKVTVDGEIYMGLWSKDADGIVELQMLKPPSE